jgi:hypothetical protein
LKPGSRFGKDYFDELLERIRSIRASERRFYLKITDIYEQCSIDYSRDADITQTFFKTVQNKLHWAITGKTAAELIADRADAEQPNMGLTTWKNAPEGRILKSDVTVAKNYLSEDELKSLERVVGMYLDYAENQASRQIAMKMADWVSKLSMGSCSSTSTKFSRMLAKFRTKSQSDWRKISTKALRNSKIAFLKATSRRRHARCFPRTKRRSSPVEAVFITSKA